MRPRVTLIGDVMLDVVTRPLGPLQATSDTLSTTVVGRGGSAANAAIGLARAGCDVTYVGAVGRDPAADVLRALFEAAGIATRLQVVDAPTGVVVAVVDGSGQRAMYTSRGANALLSEAHVVEALTEGADHVHVSGYTVLDERTRDVARSAIGAARDHGTPVSVDACSVGPLRALGAAHFLDVVAGATTIVANEEEALELGGGSLERALARLTELFAEVVVTLGSRGALARSDEGEVRVAASSDVVLDTTGAGDAATGAYLAARLCGSTRRAALESAMAAAAAVVSELGAG